MSITGVSKLQQEYKYIRKSGILAQIGGSAAPINEINKDNKKEQNFLHWSACFIGPKNTPYMGGLFFIEMRFDENYPNSPPIDVQMRTPTYHPNIDSTNGHICYSYTWKQTWKKTNNIVGIIHGIFDLLSEEKPGNGYQIDNKTKALEFKNKYALEGQNYDWNTSWNKGWKQK